MREQIFDLLSMKNTSWSKPPPVSAWGFVPVNDSVWGGDLGVFGP
jgi:hypothetical protein